MWGNVRWSVLTAWIFLVMGCDATPDQVQTRHFAATGPAVLGVVGTPAAGGLSQIVGIPDASILGSWTVSRANDVVPPAGTGDFDNDGFDDFIIKNGTKIGVLGTNSANQLVTKAIATFPSDISQNGQTWSLQSSDQVVGVGRFPGASAAVIVLKGSSGYALVGISGGAFRALRVIANGTVISGAGTSWTVGSRDRLLGIGRLNGTADCLVVRNESSVHVSTALGIWAPAASAAPTLLAKLPTGVQWPASGTTAWKLDANDSRLRVVGIADLDGAVDGRHELVLVGKSGLAILHANGTSGTAGQPFDLRAFIPDGKPIVAGSQVLGSLNAITSLVDLDKAGSADLLFQTEVGISIVTRNSTTPWTFSETSKLVYGNATTTGAWPLDARDQLLPFASDYNASAQNDFVITNKDKLGFLSRDAASLKAIASNAYSALPFSDSSAIVGTGRYDRSGRPGLLFKLPKVVSIPAGAVLTFAYNNQRTGVNPEERTITPALLATNGLRLVHKLPIRSRTDSQVLYVPGVNVKGTTSNLIIATDWLNHLYVWKDNGALAPTLLTTTPIHLKDPENPTLRTTDRRLQATPVVDYGTKKMYFVFSTNNAVGGNSAYWVARLDLQTLDSSFSTMPFRRIDATVPRSDGRALRFEEFADFQFQRPGLLLSKGSLYVAFGAQPALERGSEYHGWVFRYDAATLDLLGVFNTSPNESPASGRWAPGAGAGIWQGGGGLAADDDGNVYLMTGNGPSDPAKKTFGDYFLKLAPRGYTLQLAKAYATDNAAQDLFRKDWDLGSGGPVILLDKNLVVGGGKEGKYFVLNKNTFAKAAGPYQAFTSIYDLSWRDRVEWEGGPHLHSQPVYFNGHIYQQAEVDYLKAFSVASDGKLTLAGLDAGRLVQPLNTMHDGVFMWNRSSLSADGKTNSVLWSQVQAKNDDFSACDSNPLANEADQLTAFNPTPDSSGNLMCLASYRFPVGERWIQPVPPTVAAGRIFMPVANEASGEFAIYVLAPGINPSADTGCPGLSLDANCMGLVFANRDARGVTSTGDWAPGSYKAECPSSQFGMGLSTDAQTTFQTRAMFCGTTESLRTSHGGSSGCVSVDFSNASVGWQNNFDPDQPWPDGTDWDFGSYKGECAQNMFVAGVAQKTTASATPHALSHLLCCPHDPDTFDQATCRTLVVTAGGLVEVGSVNFDWDPPVRNSSVVAEDAPNSWFYNYRFECRLGAGLAGVSRDPATGALHAIRCCDVKALDL